MFKTYYSAVWKIFQKKLGKQKTNLIDMTTAKIIRILEYIPTSVSNTAEKSQDCFCDPIFAVLNVFL